MGKDSQKCGGEKYETRAFTMPVLTMAGNVLAVTFP
jgi:hypothetical protein